MKKTFMGKDFMLGSETAVRIYEQYARSLPIIDYHCHINPGEIAENLRSVSYTHLNTGVSAGLGGYDFFFRMRRKEITGKSLGRGYYGKYNEG